MRRRQLRGAFTLVELLVAMALILFIVSILSAAFTVATNSFRELKASGDMAGRLRRQRPAAVGAGGGPLRGQEAAQPGHLLGEWPSGAGILPALAGQRASGE